MGQCLAIEDALYSPVDVQGQCEGTLVKGIVSPNKVNFIHCLSFQVSRLFSS